MYSAVKPLRRIIVCSRVSELLAFAYLQVGGIFADSTCIFAFEHFHAFTVMQTRPHELWARFFGSTLEERQRYTPTDCFDTFPFPAGFETNTLLETTGRVYYEFREVLMHDLWLGLNEIYNLFHSPDDEALMQLEDLYHKREVTNNWRTFEGVPADHSPQTVHPTPATALAGIQRLRDRHSAMDNAVLTAYGWTDLLPKCTCEFLLNYEDDEIEARADESTGRKKKRPWRYRWPDEVRDEVLARLLKLNAERAEQELLVGGGVAKTAKTAKKSTAKTSKDGKMQLGLGFTTLGGAERKLPTDFRLPVSQPLLYTMNLVVALLSEAGGSLSWPRLLDAFILATTPKLTERLAPADDSARVKAWAARWNETVTDGLLIPSLNQLGAKNLSVTENNEDRVFHLLDGPRQPATDDVAYDAWLALRITGTLTSGAVQVPERTKWTKEVNKLELA